MILLGGRVLKTGAAAGLSVFISHLLNLESVVFSSLIAVLSVQRSFFSSLQQSVGTIISVLMGSVFGMFFAFTNIGLNPLAVAGITIVIITICLKIGWQEFITIFVITTITFMAIGTDDIIAYAGDRILSGLIGAGCALSLNMLFLPYSKKPVLKKLHYLNQNTRKILEMISEHLIKDKYSSARVNTDDEEAEGVKVYSNLYIENELYQLRKEVESGISMAKLLREEQRYRFMPDTPSEIYMKNFHVLDRLIDNLLELNNLTRGITISVPQAIPLIRFSRLMCRVQRRFFAGKNVPVNSLSNLMDNLERSNWWRALPSCEDDFYTRAALLHYLTELRKYYRNISKLTPLYPEPKKPGFFSSLWQKISKRKKQIKSAATRF